MPDNTKAISENPPVSEFMTQKPATVDAGFLAQDALDRMYNDNVRHLPVVDESGGLVGIVSSRDIASFATESPKEFEKALVSETMAKEPFQCSGDTPLAEVVLQMETRKLGSAIVTEDNKPVGIFTTQDALHAVRSLLAHEHVPTANAPRHVLTDEEKAAPRTHVRHGVPTAQKIRWGLFPR
jgi:acetoin utilization protein AcuB